MELEGFDEISGILRAGVYALVWRGEVVYVGKSKSMYSRIYTHRNLWNQARRGKAAPNWLPTSVKGILFDEVHIRPCSLEAIDGLEKEMINRYKPKYNIALKDKEKVASPFTIKIGNVCLMVNAHAKPTGIHRRV